MTTSLGPLYHWSPRDRLKSIRRLGLVPGRPGVHALAAADETNEFSAATAAWRAPWVCLGTSPLRAWRYSHGTWRTQGTFDLWQVMLDPGDEVEVKTVHGTELLEVRVHNRIPKSRLSWIGERTNDGTVRPG